MKLIKGMLLVLLLYIIGSSVAVAAVIAPVQSTIEPRSIQLQIKRGCAPESQRAVAYANGCCRGLMVNRDGVCFKPRPCSRLNEPALYKCCPGLIDINGFCKRELSDEAKRWISAAARGAAGSLPSIPYPTPQKCAPEGAVARNFEEGCCEGLIQRGDVCRYEPPPCVREGQSVNSGGVCCSNLARSCTCVRPR